MPDELPFEPETMTPVDEALPAALADVDDVEVVRELQAADGRATAQKHYRVRLAELGDSRDPRGYTEHEWAGKATTYQCEDCAFAHSNEPKVKAHVASRHGG